MADQTVRGFMNDDGSLTNRTREFYLFKTIQKAHNFMVMFDETWTPGYMAADYGQVAWQDMSSYHAISVDIPDYQFQKEQFKAGPFVNTFPVLNHEGFNFSIKMEEDYNGRVKALILGLTSKIIADNGYYNALDIAMIPQIVVDIYRPDGDNIWKVKFLNCYFLKADGGNYDYSSNEKITYTLEFNCDHYTIEGAHGALNKTLIRNND
jgi:hypothetical protein